MGGETRPDVDGPGRTDRTEEEWSESEEGGDNQTPFVVGEREKRERGRLRRACVASCVLRARPDFSWVSLRVYVLW